MNAGIFESWIGRISAEFFGLRDLRGGPLRGMLVLADDAQPTGGLTSMMPALMIILLLFYFLILRPQKNKEQSFRSMIDNLKEKDRIVTIGGIHGVITNIGKGSEIVTVRIDESSGTKIRIGTSAITRVVTDENNKEK